ncbi:MAG: phosphate ABC transporter permease family protein [Thalassovita sp.]|nr:phosphate ABC transporter permease family protein [Thalassovita sp.]
MSAGLVTLAVILIAVSGFLLGRFRAMHAVGGDIRKLHSRPNYYGLTVAIFSAVPALLLTLAWLLLQPLYIEGQVSGMIVPGDIPEGGSLDLVMTDVRRIADGLDAAVAAGNLTEEQIGAFHADTSDLRAELGDVGIAVASEVKQNVFVAAKAYRELSSDLRGAMAVAVS